MAVSLNYFFKAFCTELFIVKGPNCSCWNVHNAMEIFSHLTHLKSLAIFKFLSCTSPKVFFFLFMLKKNIIAFFFHKLWSEEFTKSFAAMLWTTLSLLLWQLIEPHYLDDKYVMISIRYKPYISSTMSFYPKISK